MLIVSVMKLFFGFIIIVIILFDICMCLVNNLGILFYELFLILNVFKCFKWIIGIIIKLIIV